MPYQRISDLLKTVSQCWQTCSLPSDSIAIQNLIAYADIALPAEYLALLAFSDGAGGPLPVEPGWFQMWLAKDVIEMNKGYGVSESIPGFFGFGSNGGGELLAFDARTPLPYKIYTIPFIPMDEKEAILVADDFATFLEMTGDLRS